MENYKSWQRNISLYFIQSPTLSPPPSFDKKVSPSLSMKPFPRCRMPPEISIFLLSSTRLYALYDRPIDHSNKFSENTITRTLKSLFPFFFPLSRNELQSSRRRSIEASNSTRGIVRLFISIESFSSVGANY